MYISIFHLDDVERARARRISVSEPSIVVGSDLGCDIVIDDDPEVAPKHVRITAQRDTAIFEDLDTPGGTYVGEQAISEATAVPPGKHVRIGRTLLTIRVPLAPWHAPGETVRHHELPPATQPLARDPVELAFVAALRAQPSDDGAREVYADWLEGRGLHAKAAFVRSEVGLESHRRELQRTTESAWRAIVARVRLPCRDTGCPGRWELLAPTFNEHRRACPTCRRDLVYLAGVGSPDVIKSDAIAYAHDRRYTRPSDDDEDA